MKIILKLFYLIILILVPSCQISTDKTISFRKLTGQWAEYEFQEKFDSLPDLSHIVISFPKQNQINKVDVIWFRLEAFSDKDKLYSLAMLVPSLDFLYPCGQDVKVFRYILFPADSEPVEYITAQSGEAVVPKFNFFKNLLPHALKFHDPGMPFFKNGSYLGKPISLSRKGKDESYMNLDSLKLLSLDQDILIGNSRSFRDDQSGRIHQPGASWEGPAIDYTYVPLTKRDYKKMIEAGMNIFRVPYNHLQWIINEPVYFLVRSGFNKIPEILYRSNFFGSVMYMDEPAIRVMAFEELTEDFVSPQKAADLVIELTRGRYQGNGGYGQRNLHKLLTDAGYDFGDLKILQPDFPVWETVPSSIWYECEAGISGWCFEGRFDPEWFSGLVKSELGIDFPNNAESCIKYHYAFFTGAARNFNMQWGAAIYGQMMPEAAKITFPMAYERGAKYFWFWTSDHAHHVPFSEQLELTRKFKEYISNNPRKKSPEESVLKAKVAIALPWGYLCDHYQLKHYLSIDPDFNTGRMWFSKNMEMTDRNSEGIRYRDILATIVKQAVELMESNQSFDFIFLRKGEKNDNYETIYRVLETGEIIIE
jgi:hypothetical protein